MIKQLVIICILVIISLFMGINTFAQGTSGFHTPIDGALGLAQGNAFTARADDPTAINFNPAGLTQLQRPQISLGTSFVLAIVEYHSDNVSEDMDTDINTIPNLYFASPIIKDKLAAGLGVTVPYGLRGKWPEDGFSRFVITDFDLRIISVNPTLAFKPFPFLSLGVGLDYYYAESGQSKRINVALLNSALTGLPIDNSTPEGFQDGNIHGDAFGYNVGVLWNITPRHSIGISFRSKADIDYEGELRFSNLSGAVATLFGGKDFTSHTTTTATIPEMLSFGYAFHETPVPSETFEPSVPQGSRHGLFTGFGYSWGKNLNKRIDFAYGVIFGEDRNVNNSVGDAVQGPIDGHYDVLIHVVAVNFNYRF